MKKAIVAICLSMMLLSYKVHAEDISDTDPIFSVDDIETFIQASRCLSIKASRAEKLSFISTELLPIPKDLFGDQDSFEREDRALDSDTRNIKLALSRYCQQTNNSVKSILASGHADITSWKRVVFENMVKSLIMEQVADRETRNSRFVFDYSAAGTIESSPY